jgi:hypothetical protein
MIALDAATAKASALEKKVAEQTAEIERLNKLTGVGRSAPVGADPVKGKAFEDMTSEEQDRYLATQLATAGM